jgi:hypothetical protein
MVDGLPGSGKSYYMTLFGLMRWKSGQTIHPNYNIYFSDDNANIEKWQDFQEILTINGGEKGGLIMIDEAYKIFDCRKFMSLPIQFSEKIAESRHDGLDIITATQNFSDLDKRVRDKIFSWFHCRSIIRLPLNQTRHPIFQWIRVSERQRFIKNDKSTWKTIKNYNIFVSRFWTKKLYDSFANLKLSQFICRYKIKKGKPVMIIASREAINRGKVRGF